MPSPALDAPRRMPLVQTLGARSNVAFTAQGQPTDAMLVNCFGERYQDESGQGWQVEKRPGLGAPIQTPGSATGGGMLNANGNLYSVSGTELYINGVAQGAVGAGPYWWMVESPLSNGSVAVVINDGGSAYVSNGGAPVLITDSNFPTSLAGSLQYLDGTTYAMDVHANIYNSQLGSPSNWTPQSFLSALGNGDRGVYLARQLSYIIAIKSRSFLVYYDAANATGSPLGIVQGASQSIGCVNPYTVQQLDDDLYWLAINQTGNMWITRLRNLVSEKISTPAVDRLLSNYSTAYQNVFYSWVMRMNGHRFYGLTSTQLNLTLVYDIDQNLWMIWTDANGNFWPVNGCSWGVDSTVAYARPLVQYWNSGNVYPIDIDFVYPTDNGAAVPVHIITPNFDGDVDRIKQLNVLRLTADQQPGNAAAIRWSDDDYQSWSPYQAIDLSINRPIIQELGSFYRRAFDFYHNLPLPFRVKAEDLQLDIGTS